MSSDQEWLKAELAEYINELRQFRWTVETGSQKRTFQEWAHGKRRHSRGIDESMVTARFDDDGRLAVKRWALPCGRPDWFECDEEAFHGFAMEGEPGLVRGVHLPKAPFCPCDKKTHRSSVRAQAFARRVAQEAGTAAHQRDYRCDWNPRAFHLSSKKNGEPIPGAYVVLTEGWNG
jgi:hypothetical protein